MAESTAGVPVEIIETIGLIPHPAGGSNAPIEPYVSDVLPDLLDKYDWLGIILAVFDSDPGLGENPKPPSIHVFFDEETDTTGVPMSAGPIKSHSDAERWLEGHWHRPRQDFNISRCAPQLVLKVGDQTRLVVSTQLDKAELGRLKHNERWTADLGSMDQDSLEYRVVAAIARDYA